MVVESAEEVGGAVCETHSSVHSADKVFDILPQREGDFEGMPLKASGPLEKEGEADVGKEEKQAPLGIYNGTVLVLNETGLVMSETDIALDLCEAQSLQNMDFLKKGSGKEVEVLGANAWKGMEGLMGPGMNVSSPQKFPLGGKFLEEDFPPLSKEINTRGKSKTSTQGEGKQGRAGKMEGNLERGADAGSGRPFVAESGTFFVRQQHFHVQGSNGVGQKQSLADMLKAGEKDPVMFEPDKIKRIGVVGERSGLPAIYFSGSDNTYLAEKLGHAVVGKFSHSIPSSQQIQKALQGLKFWGAYSWSYINAKHVLIQFEVLSDYAKILSGPNGRPVWFIERHPMRVFKWTPDFDPFFESPIAAVWCNLVGLPIHLFEKSALFAIGGLLGTPIQVDHDTISKRRLSFARLCIEIDISKSQMEETVIDIQGTKGQMG